MANPTWFVAKDYLANKLAQLQATEPEGNWNVYSMAQAFANSGYEGEEGAYQHFLDFGMNEEVSPNALFDVDAYYANKLDALKSDPKTATEWADKTVADVKDAFAANGLSAWEHYQQFGTAEGINPSADFDTMKYLQAKTDAMNAVGGDKVWTVADIADAFAENGLSAIQHYELYGKSGAEGEVAEGYNPAPVVTLTFADALAAETLPAEYFLADGAASLEGVAVADLEAAQAKAQSIFDGALNKADLEYSVAYTLEDTLANIMGADAAVLEGHAYTLTDGAADLGDGSIEAIVAAQAKAQAFIEGSANETKPELVATYTLNDTLANIMSADNAALVEDRDYSLTDLKADLGEVAVADINTAKAAAAIAAQAVIAGATNASELGGDLTYTFVLNDTVAKIQALGTTLPEGATGYILTDTVAEISAATAQFVGAALNYMLSDSIENILEAPAGILAGHTYELTSGRIDFGTDLSIEHVRYAIAAAQSVIDGSTNAEKPALDADYTINDTVANVTANDDIIATHSYSLTDTSASIDAAASALLTNATTVAVEDTLANIAVSSILANSEVDTVAADVNADTTISVATLDALSSKVTLDASVASAVTVNASTDTAGVTINLAGAFNIGATSEALTFNAIGGSGVDTITAHAKGGVINAGAGNDKIIAGAGVDTLTGGEGADTFTFNAATDSTPTVTDHITDFVGGSDKIAFTNAATFANVTISGATDLADAVSKAFTEDVTNASGIQAIQFTYDNKTYFAVEASASASATGALVVEVTGVTGTVDTADFIAIP